MKPHHSPVDFHTPEKETLSHNPSAGSSLADRSPFYLLHTCNTATCLASTRTSEPSSCVQDDPVKRGGKSYRLYYPQRRKTVSVSFIYVSPFSPGIPLLRPCSSCLDPFCSVWFNNWTLPVPACWDSFWRHIHTHTTHTHPQTQTHTPCSVWQTCSFC